MNMKTSFPTIAPRLKHSEICKASGYKSALIIRPLEVIQAAASRVLNSSCPIDSDQSVWRRMVFIYALYHYSGFSVKKIGALVNRHYSIVYYSLRLVANRCQFYPEIRKQILELEELIEHGNPHA